MVPNFDGRAGTSEVRIRLADGRTLACLALGDPHGVPVLYFHGYPGSRLEGCLASDAAHHYDGRRAPGGSCRAY